MRIVVKIGSSSLVSSTGEVRDDTIERLVADVAAATYEGHQIVVVSSGAIATGLGVLDMSSRPADLPSLQAASAVGQGTIVGAWSRALSEHDLVAAQILMTMHDVAHRAAYVNARNTLERLLEWRCVPIVNENDTTATDEITFGDNDALAAQIAVLLRADRLVLLTDTDGLYTAHPDSDGAELITVVDDHSLLQRIDVAEPGSHWGSGGMRSKVIAAEMASTAGVVTTIANAAASGVVSHIVDGGNPGTTISAGQMRGSSYKLWLRYARKPVGSVIVDEGAAVALVDRGASLLPVGVREVRGAFDGGDVIDVVSGSGDVLARGVSEYGSSEVAMFLEGAESARGAGELIHRDQLVLLAGSG